jgi:FkbM family methyltransferase
MNFRKIIEKLSRGVILKRKLPKEFGSRPILVTPEAGLRYWKLSLDNVDPMLYEFSKKYVYDGAIVWDIGANLGFFTLTAAEKVGRNGNVIAFEADIFISNILKNTTKLNLDRNIDVFPLAISQNTGIAQFNIAQRSRSTNYLDTGVGSTQTGGIRETYNVFTTSLDDLSKIIPLPNIVKIDIEGAEMLLFKGASDFFNLTRPIILCEVSPNTYDYIQDFLNLRGYQFFDGQQIPALVPFDISKSENLLAIPNI